jgi:hypothetical protein
MKFIDIAEFVRLPARTLLVMLRRPVGQRELYVITAPTCAQPLAPVVENTTAEIARAGYAVLEPDDIVALILQLQQSLPEATDETAGRVWEALYPDRRPWAQLEESTRRDWVRFTRIARALPNAS